jgi:hypothetical protein
MRAASLLVLFGLALFPAGARANGNNTHVWISHRAVELLPEGRLRALISRPELRRQLDNGTIFPDGGYAVEARDFAEQAHFEPFIERYLAWIRAHHPPPFDAAGERHVAFLLGVASHSMADLTFDAMFMAKARQLDAAGWSDELTESLDTASDALLVAETGQALDLAPWYPEVLPELFHALGHPEVTPALLEQAQLVLTSVVVGHGQDAARRPDVIAGYRARYPWSAAHLLDEDVPGSPPVEARFVAAYWQALWDRLHGHKRAENLIIGLYPAPGGAGHPTGRDDAFAQLVVVFGHGIRHASLPDGSVEVRDRGGALHPVGITRFYAGEGTTLVRLHPRGDWPAGEDFTATLPASLVTLDGLSLGVPFAFSFSTRPGASRS